MACTNFSSIYRAFDRVQGKNKQKKLEPTYTVQEKAL